MIELYTIGFGEKKEATLDILGGKAFNLNVMANLGVNVPPAVVVPTTYCSKVNNKMVSAMEISVDVFTSLENISNIFGYMPLFSIRSGAKVSMPGMLNTILNVGLCESTIPTWESRIGKRATWDSYRRLIQMFGDVVFSIPSDKYEVILTEAKAKEGVSTDAELSLDMLQVIAKRFLEITPDFPQTFKMQLRRAIAAVFNSWNNARAIEYRNLNKIPHDIGTAVVVQAMVFGNMNNDSGTGVLFTRNPSTGENVVYGEYLVNAQGEDVVSGVRTPEPLSTLQNWDSTVYFELMSVVKNLEAHYRDMQDIEFTIQDKKLFILQTRAAKRTAISAVKIAVDMVSEGIITKEESFKRVTYDQYLKAQHPSIDPNFNVPATAVGIPASSGFAKGTVVFSSKKAIELSKIKPVILVSKETTPEDITGMNASVGIFTQTGGASSHAALVARGMDKVCVVGCLDLKPTGDSKKWTLNDTTLIEGNTIITIEGNTGKVWVDIDVPVVGSSENESISKFNSWVFEGSKFTPKVTSGSSGYLDTSKYDNDPIKLKEIVANFKGIIALNTSFDNLDPWDTHLFELVKDFDKETIQANKVVSLLDIPNSNSETKYIDLCGYNLTKSTRKILESKGVKIISEIESLSDIVLASGLVHENKSLLDNEAYKKVLDMKRKLGEDISFLRKVSSIEEMTTEPDVVVVTDKETVIKSMFKAT